MLKADVLFANYGKDDYLTPLNYRLVESGALDAVFCPAGSLTKIGHLELPLDGFDKATRLDLIVKLEGTEIENSYPIWIYPDNKPVCPDDIYETESFDEKAVQILKNGGKVYLTPHSTIEALPHSAKAQFSTDFWSVGTFPNQEGTMGQLIK